eukprot:1652566-Rhodomonas_salina.4
MYHDSAQHTPLLSHGVTHTPSHDPFSVSQHANSRTRHTHLVLSRGLGQPRQNARDLARAWPAPFRDILREKRRDIPVFRRPQRADRGRGAAGGRFAVGVGATYEHGVDVRGWTRDERRQHEELGLCGKYAKDVGDARGCGKRESAGDRQRHGRCLSVSIALGASHMSGHGRSARSTHTHT